MNRPDEFSGKRAVMLVWNGFVHDARVTREAETLVEAGMNTLVISILSADRPVVNEVTARGVQVHRVSGGDYWLARLPLAPRIAYLWLSADDVDRGASIQRRLARRARWWELDKKAAMLLGILIGNLQMVVRTIRFCPDVLHANDVNTLIPGWMAANCVGASLVYDAHEISADREGYAGRAWLVRLLEKHLGGGASGRITTTQTRADWFASNYGFSNVAVVQNRPILSEVHGDRIRERLTVPDDSVVFLYQGGLQPGRGLHNLVEAVRAVERAHLVFIGDGLQRESLQAAVAAAAIDDRVHFVGQVALDELACWTASADVGMQTLRNTCLNHYSTDSNKLFEYVMGGLPVIASDFPEIRRVVETYQVGELVDPASVEEVAAAMQRLIEDEDRRDQLSANAVASRRSLDWHSQVPAFIEVYRKALADV
jgi:glycosyltransferase involved in cell wall biosynthesis